MDPYGVGPPAGEGWLRRPEPPAPVRPRSRERPGTTVRFEVSRPRPAPSLRSLVPAVLIAVLAVGSAPPAGAVAAVSPSPTVAAVSPATAGQAGDQAPDTSLKVNPRAAQAGTALQAGTPTPTPAPTPAAAPPLTPADAGGAAEQAGLQPSIVYEEASAHAADRITFKPGGQVTVGFTPRAGDRWPVDGRAPSALPAGRATGRQMAASAQGTAWADLGHGSAGSAAPSDPAPARSDVPVDAPAGAPASAARAVGFAIPEPAPAFDLAAASGLRRQVFGFLPYWEMSGASTKLDYDVLSTIAYFSVGADAKGNLRKKNSNGTNTTGWGGWTSSSMTSVTNRAHARGTRVVLTLSVFAWTTSQASVQKALLGSSAARRNFARQAAAAVRDRGADGINLDFEPLASTYSDEFVALLRAVRSELNKVRPGYQLTYDTTGSIGNYPLEASVAAGAADAIFIMGYDYRAAGSRTAGSVDPLSGTGYDLADTVREYVARVRPSRIILGIPWYGRAWSTVSDAVRSRTQTGAKFGYSTAVNYETLVDLVARYGRRWDAAEQSPYVAYRRQNCTARYGCVTSWRQVYYDDAASMTRRFALVNDYNLRGAGIWALGYDGGHPELYRAISDSFLVDKAAPQAGVKVLPATEADEGFVVSWSARDVSGVTGYDVQSSTDGGPWTAWRTGTRATSDVWLGNDAHGYAFRVRATDAKGHVGAWNVTSAWTATPSLSVGGFGRVVTDGLPYRTGPSTSAARLGTLAAGTIVAITRGPVSAGGYTWYEVTQPIAEWSPVSFVEHGVWLAASSSSTTRVAASRAPNSTVVDAGLRDLDFGSGSITGANKAGLRAFSPDGDGSGDTLRIRWTATVAMATLRLNVYRSDGTLIGSRAVPERAAGNRTWDWDGKVGGVALRRGSYALQLVGTAGGRIYHAPSARPVTPAQLAAFGITVDLTDPVLTSAAATASLISPNGDGNRESVRFTLRSTGATSWSVRLANAGGTVVRTATGKGAKGSFTWRGTSDAGTRVPDGRYTASLIAMDNAGNTARRTLAVVVDTTPPAVTQTASLDSFSPNRDGAADSVVLGWTGPETVTGTASIWRGATRVRSWKVTAGTGGSVTWNGRTTAGAAVVDGRYRFRVDVKDRGGNRTVVNRTITVDRTAGFLRWSQSFFPQDGDPLLPTSKVTFRLTRTAATTLRLYDANGVLVRTVWTGRRLAAGSRSWTWNGKLADGTSVPQGRYEARLEATSSIGTQQLSGSVWAAAFAATPSAATVRVRGRLTIRFATIEALSTRPAVSWTQPGRATVTVKATRLADGTFRATFRVFPGKAGAGKVRISAKDSGGQVNAMVLPIRVAR